MSEFEKLSGRAENRDDSVPFISKSPANAHETAMFFLRDKKWWWCGGGGGGETKTVNDKHLFYSTYSVAKTKGKNS